MSILEDQESSLFRDPKSSLGVGEVVGVDEDDYDALMK